MTKPGWSIAALLGARLFWCVLLACGLLGCGSGTSVRGEYAISGAAFCEVSEPGEPLDVFSMTGTADVQELPEGRPEGCQHLLWIRTDLCETCAPNDTQLCLREPTTDGGWTVGPGYPDELGLDSIDFVDWRGGISQDLFVSAQQVTGTFGPEGDAPVIEIDATGTVKTGVSGVERTASIHCEIHTERVP